MIKRADADADANGKLATFNGTFTRIRHLLSKVPYEDFIPNYYRCAGPIGCPEATQPPSRGSRAAAGRAGSGGWRAPARIEETWALPSDLRPGPAARPERAAANCCGFGYGSWGPSGWCCRGLIPAGGLWQVSDGSQGCQWLSCRVHSRGHCFLEPCHAKSPTVTSPSHPHEYA